MKCVSQLLALAMVCALASPAAKADPRYTVIDLGVIGSDSASQAFGISPNGQYVVGRSLGSNQSATLWSASTGLLAQPNIAGRRYAVANAVNNSGVAVGNSLATSFGSGAVPVSWSGGVMTQLPLPAGEVGGRANAINSAGVVVGSVGGGSTERATLYSGSTATVIAATTANGSWMNVAYGINDSGLIVGTGIDPSNAAVTVGLLYHMNTGTMSSLGSLSGGNSALAFAISSAGQVVGASSFNSGAGVPFTWTAAGGMVQIPLPTGTSQGTARAVNSAGWAVGYASSNFSIPFVYDGTQTYRLADVVPVGSGWDFSTNTSASAVGISEDGTIVGTAVFNGATHAYAMMLTPVPEPATWAMLCVGGLLMVGVARRQRRITCSGLPPRA